jgi:hypothetical protein
MRTWTDEQLIDAVKTSNKFIDVALKLGLNNLGTNYNTIKKHIKLLNLDTSHFLNRKELSKEARKKINKLSHDELFTINNIDRKYIKKIIIKDNLLPYVCSLCGISEWIGKQLSLHLDHINGVNNDNRLSNLRFLCPNCHSLTETYCAKNKKNNNETKLIKYCSVCKKEISNYATMCRKCSSQNRKTKIEWLDDQTLLDLVKQSSYCAVAKQLNVSANAVKKHLHSRGLLK